MPCPRRALSCITPPHILRRLLDNPNPEIREAALSTLLMTARMRGERSLRASFLAPSSERPPNDPRLSERDLASACRTSQIGGRTGLR
jgi:hypothetical protein